MVGDPGLLNFQVGLDESLALLGVIPGDLFESNNVGENNRGMPAFSQVWLDQVVTLLLDL